ncbi:hypothetical protein C7380_1083 [Oceanotoga teriensis]|uniref:Fibronectin type-III domain-containing protein n=1 Tax=Oceanotoga teriensis TaxID=515440 RepID=A0AA45C6Q7_9BACT|nr:hypothetical protein [Oceanotoga teriensis]PWJ93174.1 hypothetical protein C7380_1083 [Oceanotoga teriensis]
MGGIIIKIKIYSCLIILITIIMSSCVPFKDQVFIKFNIKLEDSTQKDLYEIYDWDKMKVEIISKDGVSSNYTMQKENPTNLRILLTPGNYTIKVEGLNYNGTKKRFKGIKKDVFINNGENKINLNVKQNLANISIDNEFNLTLNATIINKEEKIPVKDLDSIEIYPEDDIKIQYSNNLKTFRTMPDETTNILFTNAENSNEEIIIYQNIIKKPKINLIPNDATKKTITVKWTPEEKTSYKIYKTSDNKNKMFKEPTLKEESSGKYIIDETGKSGSMTYFIFPIKNNEYGPYEKLTVNLNNLPPIPKNSFFSPNGTTDESTKTINFSWKFEDPENDELNYTLYINGTGEPLEINVDSDTNYTLENHDILKPETTYTWYIEASDENNKVKSETYKFKTGK